MGRQAEKEYILNRNGDKIYDKSKRQYKCKSIPTTDWNEQTKAEREKLTAERGRLNQRYAALKNEV